MTSDGHTFELSIQIISQSVLLKDIVEDLSSADTEDIQLATIDKDTFELVMKYCDYAHVHSPPVIPTPLTKSLQEHLEDQWYFEFIDLGQAELFDLIMAANYLNI